MKRYHVLISGRVQGVFFRQFIAEKSHSLGIKGFVRNLSNSKVEAVFEGEEEALKEIIKECKKGPPNADIINIKVREQPYKKEFDDFEIRDQS